MLPSGSTLPGHVLVVGVDGVRFDFLEADSAPSVRALGEAGFLVPVPVDGAAAAVDVGTLPFDPRVQVLGQEGV